MDAETRGENSTIQPGAIHKAARIGVIRGSCRNIARWTLLAALVWIIAGSRSASAVEPGDGAQRPQFVLQAGHTGAVTGVAFSPDGKLLASGSDDTTVILWNVQTGQMLCTLKAQNGAVHALAFSPDGKLLVTGSTDGTAILWDAATGQLIRKLLDPREGNRIPVAAVAFSSDGRQVTAALSNSSAPQSAVEIWDAATGRMVNDLKGSTGLCRCLALSPDGKKVAGPNSARPFKVRQDMAGSSSMVVWDARTGAPLQTLEGPSSGAGSAAFSPDGKQLATAAPFDSLALLWDAQTGKKLQTLKRHTQQVMAEAFSPDGRLLATGSQDGTAILWDAQTGERILTLIGRGGGDNVASVAFSPDGRQVATGNSHKITLWDAQTGEIVRIFSGRNIPINSALFSSDGKQIATVCDRTAVFWDTASGKRVASISGLENVAINSLAFSADGSQAVTTSDQMETALWDARTGQKVRAFEGYQFPRPSAAAISPDGKQVAVITPVRNVVLWDAGSGQMLRTIPETPGAVPGRPNPNYYAPPSEQFSSMAFSADGKQMLTSPLNGGGAVALWEVQTAHKLRTFAGENNSFLSGAAFRPGGKEVAAISSSGDILFWDAQTGHKLRTLRQSADPAPAADQKAADRIARRIERQRLMAMQNGGGYSPQLATFEFSPDGKQVVIGSATETASLWNAQTGEKLRTLNGHCRRLSPNPFSKDGRFLVGVYDGGAAGLWDASTGELLASLLTTDGGNEWLVVTPEGFFDGSPRGRRLATFRTGPGLKLVVGDKLGKDFYRPGLLSQILSGARPK